jgi:glycosyltransferase involved in cell wall biosynthesis
MLTLARGFVARGRPVDLVLVQADGAYLDDIPRGVRLIDLGVSRTASSLVPLIRYLRRERPHALLSTSTHANVVALVAKRIARVPTRHVVRQPMELTPVRSFARIVFLLARPLYRWADGIVASSERVARDVAHVTGLPRERITVAPSPLVTRDLFTLARAPLPDSWFVPGAAPVVLGVGRLDEQKDFATLIRAFVEVRKQRPAHLLILGEGAERGALEAMVRNLELVDHAALPGFVRNPFAYMARAAVYVLSSVAEGMPGTLVQALACGAPVVATDCPCGPREVLQNGRFGRLVAMGDAAGLAHAILTTLSRPRRAAPPEAWQPYSEDVGVDAYLRVLDAGSQPSA